MRLFGECFHVLLFLCKKVKITVHNCIHFEFQPIDVEDDLYQDDSDEETAVSLDDDDSDIEDVTSDDHDERETCRLEIVESEELGSFTNRAFNRGETSEIHDTSVGANVFVKTEDMCRQHEHSGSKDEATNYRNSCVDITITNQAETYV